MHLHTTIVSSATDKASFEDKRKAAQTCVFASGDPTLDALRTQVAQRLNLLDPASLLDMDAHNLRELLRELDEDDAQAARSQISDEDLEAQALAASDTPCRPSGSQ